MPISWPLKHIILLVCLQRSFIHVLVLQDRRSSHPLVGTALQGFRFNHFGLRIFLHDLVEGILELLFIKKVNVGFISFQFLATTFDNALVRGLYHV